MLPYSIYLKILPDLSLTPNLVDNKKEEIRISISSLFKEDIAKHKVNAIGGLMED
jgi:hypothetical protein